MAFTGLPSITCLRSQCGDVIHLINSFADYYNPTGRIAFENEYPQKIFYRTSLQHIQLSDDKIVFSRDDTLFIYFLDQNDRSCKYKCDGYIQHFFIVRESILICQTHNKPMSDTFLLITVDKGGIVADPNTNPNLNLEKHPQVVGFSKYRIWDITTIEDVTQMLMHCSDPYSKSGGPPSIHKILTLTKQFKVVSVVDVNFIPHTLYAKRICCDRNLDLFICVHDSRGKCVIHQIAFIYDKHIWPKFANGFSPKHWVNLWLQFTSDNIYPNVFTCVTSTFDIDGGNSGNRIAGGNSGNRIAGGNSVHRIADFILHFRKFDLNLSISTIRYFV